MVPAPMLTCCSALQVFRKINKNLPTLTLLELQYVSPKLLAVKDLDLAIPGPSPYLGSLQATDQLLHYHRYLHHRQAHHSHR